MNYLIVKFDSVNKKITHKNLSKEELIEEISDVLTNVGENVLKFIPKEYLIVEEGCITFKTIREGISLFVEMCLNHITLGIWFRGEIFSIENNIVKEKKFVDFEEDIIEYLFSNIDLLEYC